MAYAIHRSALGSSTFYSAATGRKLGNPLGGWIGEKTDALQFAREKDAQEFIDTFMVVMRDGISVIPV